MSKQGQVMNALFMFTVRSGPHREAMAQSYLQRPRVGSEIDIDSIDMGMTPVIFRKMKK